MELVDGQIGFREYLARLIRNAETDQEITILTDDGQELKIYGQAYLGIDFLEFQPNGADYRIVTVPFGKISRVKL